MASRTKGMIYLSSDTLEAYYRENNYMQGKFLNAM